MKRWLVALTFVGCGSATAQPTAIVVPPPAPAPAPLPVETAPAPIARVVPPKPKVAAFETDLDYECALTDTGKVACAQSGAMAWVIGLPLVDKMHIGFRFGCARATADHVLWCWGRDTAAQLGQRQIRPTGTYPPQAVLGDDKKPWAVEDFELGDDNVCALSPGDAGLVHCWGGSIDGESGTLGKHDAKGDFLPVVVPRIVFRGGKRIYGGKQTGCAVNEKEELWCWGDQDAGYNSHGATAVPQRIAVPGHVKSMTFASGHSCLLQDNGAVFCRGWNPGGQLGSAGRPQHVQDGKGAYDSDFLAPFTKIPELAGAYIDVTAARHETCALDAEHHLTCVGTFDVANGKPLRVSADAFGDVVGLASTMGRRCALDAEGVVRCVGYRDAYGGERFDATATELEMP